MAIIIKKVSSKKELQSDQLVGLSHRGHSGKTEKAVCRDDRADARGRNGRTSWLREELRSREQLRKQSEWLREKDDNQRLWRV